MYLLECVNKDDDPSCMNTPYVCVSINMNTLVQALGEVTLLSARE